jgi:hypothetical protein
MKHGTWRIKGIIQVFITFSFKKWISVYELFVLLLFLSIRFNSIHDSEVGIRIDSLCFWNLTYFLLVIYSWCKACCYCSL